MPTTYSKNTVKDINNNDVVIYTRNTAAHLAHSTSKALGNVSIDAKLSNSTDYVATYTWSIRKLDSAGAETWTPLVVGLQTTYENADSVGNFSTSNAIDPSAANKINLWFKATNTAALWESYTGAAGELPCLGSNTTIKVDIAWHDKHNAGLSGTKAKYFRFEFPTEMQSEDPSWTFSVLDEANDPAIILE